MRLLLGEMTCVEPETLSFAFAVVSRGTRVEGCPLEIVRVPTRLRCRTCGAERGGDLLEPCVCGMPGGEGSQHAIDPTNSNIVYGIGSYGDIVRNDLSAAAGARRGGGGGAASAAAGAQGAGQSKRFTHEEL